MDTLLIILQCAVAVSILNVWLIQNKKATKWRGGEATTIIEEFKVYGLPVWFCYVIGFLKVIFAIGLIVGIWVQNLVQPAAIGLGVLLLGSIAMHLKIKDPVFKSFPAFLFVVMCAAIIVLQQAVV